MIAITVSVIIARYRRVTSMITPANRNAAVIIVNSRRDHVIIATVNKKTKINIGIKLNKIIQASAITGVMGYIWAIYYLYLVYFIFFNI